MEEDDYPHYYTLILEETKESKCYAKRSQMYSHFLLFTKEVKHQH